MNLPVKSHETLKATETRYISIVRDIINNIKETHDVYKNFKELCDKILKLKS